MKIDSLRLKNITIRESIALAVFEDLIESWDKFKSIMGTTVNATDSDIKIREIKDCITKRNNAMARLNFDVQLLGHPIGIDDFKHIYSSEYSSHILSKVQGRFNADSVESELSIRDDKTLIEYLIDAFDKSIDDCKGGTELFEELLEIANKI